MNRYALIIGINDYEDRDIPVLNYAEHDAEEVSRVLQEQCGFTTSVLLGSYATRNRILELITKNRISFKLPLMEEDDQFLLFFAGHGELVHGSYVLHPSNARLGVNYKSIPVRGISKILSNDISCRQCMCVFDACRNLALPGARSMPVLDKVSARDIEVVSRESQGKMVEVLFGCSEGQRSWEDPRLEHGILTYHLKKTLEDSRISSGLTCEMLAKRAGDRMISWLRDNRPDVFQQPHLYRPTTERNIELIGSSISAPIMEQSSPRKTTVKDQINPPDPKHARQEIRKWVRDNDAEWTKNQWKDFVLELYDSGMASGFTHKQLTEWRDDEKHNWIEEKKRRLEVEKRRKEEEQRRAEELRCLEEDRLWLQIHDSPSRHLCKDYLNRFSEGRFVSKVQDVLRELEEEQLWLKIKDSPTVSLCRDYGTRFSDGKYAHKVQEIYEGLEEEKLWRKIQKSPTDELCKDYMGRFPNGRFVSDVKKILTEVAAEAERKSRDAAEEAEKKRKEAEKVNSKLKTAKTDKVNTILKRADKLKGDQALAIYRKALEVDYNHAGTHYMMAVILLMQRNYYEAQSELKIALGCVESDNTVLIRRIKTRQGDIYFIVGDYENAYRKFKEISKTGIDKSEELFFCKICGAFPPARIFPKFLHSVRVAGWFLYNHFKYL